MTAFIIGIAGGSASGKTAVAEKIVRHLIKIGVDSVIVSQDNFYKNAPISSNITNYNFDHPDAIDLDHLYNSLVDLKNNKEVDIPINDYGTNQRSGSQKIKPAKIIIVEGIFILSDEKIRSLINLKIFVEACAEIRLLRRLKRDVQERNRTIDSLQTQYMKYVRPAYEQIIRPSKHFADITIHNEYSDGLNLIGIELVCHYIEKTFKN